MPAIRTSSDPVKTYQDQKFWAVGGMIRLVDQRDGDVRDLTIDECGRRALALAEMAVKIPDTATRRPLIKLVEDLKDVMYQAKAQGDPTDRRVVLEKVRARGASHLVRVGHQGFADAVPTFNAPRATGGGE